MGVLLRSLTIGSKALWMRLRMPGVSHRGALPGLTAGQSALREELRRDVERLSIEIGPRSVFRPGAMARTVEFLVGEAEAVAGGTRGGRVVVDDHAIEGVPSPNIEFSLDGGERKEEIIVVGAHYDSVELVEGCPGANDNGSGVAATLALMRRWGLVLVVRLRRARFVSCSFRMRSPRSSGRRTWGLWCMRGGANLAPIGSLRC